jgi:PTS system nitrogen regulatory IIA component
MKLRDILNPDDVRIDQSFRDKGQLLGVIAAECARLSGLDVRLIAEALRAREQLGSTGVGAGMAIPHARIPGLAAPVAVAYRLRKAIDFDAVDDRPVDLVVAMLSPEGADAENLARLAEISRRLRDRDVAARLRSASGPAALHRLLVDDLS